MEFKTDSVFKYQIDYDWHYATIVGFANNMERIKNVRIPERFEKYRIHAIGKRAFSGNYNIESVQLPGSLKCVEDGAFEGCKNLTNVSVRASSLTTHFLTVKDSAFSRCCNLQSFVGEDTLYISALCRAFYECKNLKNVQGHLCILDTLAFGQCCLLNNITFANKAKWCINSFDGCSVLERVFIIGEPNPNLSIDCIDWLKTRQITCPTDSKICCWAYDGVSIQAI